MGHEVCAVATTETDVVAAESLQRPDLLIADVHLAEGNGILAVAQILLSGSVPYVIMSGDRLIGEQLDPRAARLEKPFQDQNLARAIQIALAGHAAASAGRW